MGELWPLGKEWKQWLTHFYPVNHRQINHLWALLSLNYLRIRLPKSRFLWTRKVSYITTIKSSKSENYILLLSNPQTSVLSTVLKTSFTAKGSVQTQALTCRVSRLPPSASLQAFRILHVLDPCEDHKPVLLSNGPNLALPAGSTDETQVTCLWQEYERSDTMLSPLHPIRWHTNSDLPHYWLF